MTADCHTKGSIDRTAILELMKGNFKFEHEVKDYEVKVKRSSTGTTMEKFNATSSDKVKRVHWVLAFCDAILLNPKTSSERFQ